jgi:PKHD-type hydroxylase
LDIHDALVYGKNALNPKDNLVLDSRIRKAKICFFKAKNETSFLYHAFSRSIQFINQTHYNFNIYQIQNSFQYTVYNEDDQGHYKWHADMDDFLNKPVRKLTAILQLTDEDDYSGGDLELSITGDQNEAVKIPKLKNFFIIFPSYLPHRVLPVVKGTRKTIVTWVYGPRFR